MCKIYNAYASVYGINFDSTCGNYICVRGRASLVYMQSVDKSICGLNVNYVIYAINIIAPELYKRLPTEKHA